jgi:cytidylate kinase
MKQTLHERMGGYLLAHQTRHAAGGTRGTVAVTISREAGAGGSSVAHRLAEQLGRHQPAGEPAWQVYDHDLIDEVLRRHHMPPRAGAYMAEDAARFVPDTVEDLLGLHPAAPEMARRVAETMCGLVRQGNVILVGRGGNVATARMPGAIHVRLVAPHGQRVRHIEQLFKLPPVEAETFVSKTDRARRRFVRQSFGAKIDDAASYDLVLNTGRLGFDKSAEIVAGLVLERMQQGAARED